MSHSVITVFQEHVCKCLTCKYLAICCDIARQRHGTAGRIAAVVQIEREVFYFKRVAAQNGRAKNMLVWFGESIDVFTTLEGSR